MRTLTYSCNHRTLRSHAAPLWSRFSIAKLKPPDRNSLEKTSFQREAESRAAPCTQNEIAKRIEARCSYEMNPPVSLPMESPARCRRRSRCGRCMSVRHTTGSTQRDHL